MESEVLSNYKYIKKLGKGAYGEVILVESPGEELLAVKIISKQRIDQHSFNSLKLQIQFMHSLDSLNIVKLLDYKEDSERYYLFCEYCNEGDLFNQQAKQPEKIFNLDVTLEILSEVIKGLFHMHRRDILHRDIKPQNILVTKNQSKVSSYKLADLGFAKYHAQVQGTILGTEKFMSPEVFSHKSYGFEVDMWAFGVTMFFMLNMEYPFNINSHVILTERTPILKKLANNFSYRQAVEKTKKKKMETCTPEVEDLFKRMFETEGEKRIAFSEIREHPLFKKYFPEGGASSAIVYKKKLKFNPTENKPRQLIPIPDTVIMKKHKKTDDQKSLIDAEHSKAVFLRDTQSEIKLYTMILSTHQMVAIRYLLIKMYLKYLKEFIDSLTLENLQNRYPNNNWKEFFTRHSLQTMKKKYQFQFSEGEMKLNDLYDICESSVPKIVKIDHCQDFPSIFQCDYSQEKSQKNLLAVFNFCCRHCYKLFTQKQKQNPKYGYLAVVMLICVVFRKIYPDNYKEVIKVFYQYNEQRRQKNMPINFDDLRIWLASAQPTQLLELYKKVTERYMSH